MKKFLLGTLGVFAVMAGILAIRLWLADRSAATTREQFDAACAGDAACLAAARAHFAACHEEHYNHHTYTSEPRRSPISRGYADPETPQALDWHAVIECVDERAAGWQRPERFGLD